ncbi:MAG: GNAT family N-acetyltransferase [Coriobacteriia bacterium]
MSPSGLIREATAEECSRLWPAVEADRLMNSAQTLAEYRAEGSWRLRVSARGDAAILGTWRAHLDILSMRDVWCSRRRISAFVRDACEMARTHGLARVMSPLMPEVVLEPYLREGMQIEQRIIAILATPSAVVQAPPPSGVRLRNGTPRDIPVIAVLDAECFDEFWKYSEADLALLVRHERLTIAETAEGEIIGYTLTSASRGAASLGRLGVAPAHRNRGLGMALVAEAAEWAARWGAASLSLCTQEDNVASRSLYTKAGLDELKERYALALRNV